MSNNNHRKKLTKYSGGMTSGHSGRLPTVIGDHESGSEKITDRAKGVFRTLANGLRRYELNT